LTGFQAYIQSQVGERGVPEHILRDIGMLTPENFTAYMQMREQSGWWTIENQAVKGLMVDGMAWTLAHGSPDQSAAMVDMLVADAEMLRLLAESPLFAPMSAEALDALLQDQNGDGRLSGSDLLENPLVQMLQNLDSASRRELIAAMEAEGLLADPELRILVDLANY